MLISASWHGSLMSKWNASNTRGQKKLKDWAQQGSWNTSFTALLGVAGFSASPFKC